MVNKSSIRSVNADKFKSCIKLRKQGLSYSEIRKTIPVAKSTLQNWLTLAGLTLTKEHLQIQFRKRLEKRQTAIEASRITRAKKADLEVHRFVQEYKKFLNDPFFVSGLMLYQAEGSKDENCRFSNSDYRVIQTFINFVEKYLSLNRRNYLRFRIYIHETRSDDLNKIRGFWSHKLGIHEKKMKVLWKKNKITRRRSNANYVGQMDVRIVGVPYLTRKLLFMSGIILNRYCRVV